MPNKFEQYFCTSQTKALIFMTTWKILHRNY
jgi:hypothetical protein